MELLLPKRAFDFVPAHACLYCGHTLPKKKIYHIVHFGIEPELEERAARGDLNTIRCGACGEQETISVVSMVIDPKKSRRMIVYPNAATIPSHKKILKNMEALVAATVIDEKEMLSLPLICCLSQADLQSIMPLSHHETLDYGFSSEQRHRRLLATYTQCGENLLRQLHEQYEKTGERLSKEGLGDLLVIYRPTNFEASTSGKTHITNYFRSILEEEQDRRALEKIEILSELVHGQIDSFHTNEDIGDPAKLDQVSERLNEIASANDLQTNPESKFNFVRISKWFEKLGSPFQAMDALEFYLNFVDMDRINFSDLEALVAFGALLEDTERWKVMPSGDYFAVAIILIENYYTEIPEAKPIYAKALLYTSIVHSRRGRLLDAGYVQLDAARVFEELGDGEQATELAMRARDTGVDLGNVQLVDEASKLLPEIQVTESSALVGSIGEHAIVNVMPPGPAWNEINHGVVVPYGAVVVNKKPVNYDREHMDELYSDRRDRIEIFAPIQNGFAHQHFITLALEAMNFKSVTIRYWKCGSSGEAPHLSKEVIWHRSYLANLAAIDNDEERGKDDSRIDVMNWAANNGCYIWLFEEYTAFMVRLNERSETLTPDQVFFFAGTLAKLSKVAAPSFNLEPRQFAEISVRLFEKIEGQFDSMSPMQAAISRNWYATVLELTANPEKAENLYWENIGTSFGVKFDASGREEKQSARRLANVDIMCAFRTQLSLNGMNLPASAKRRLFSLREASKNYDLVTDYISRNLSETVDVDEALMEAGEKALISTSYRQVWLVREMQGVSGGIQILTPSPDKTINHERVEWETPIRFFRVLDEYYSTGEFLDEPDEIKTAEMLAEIHNCKVWASKIMPKTRLTKYSQNEGLITETICAEHYLGNIPWGFLGVMLQSEGYSSPEVCWLSAFSFASADIAQTRQKEGRSARRVSIFVDPDEDLDLEEIESRFRLPPDNVLEATLFPHKEAKKTTFLEEIEVADCIVFLGHSYVDKSDDTHSLELSDGLLFQHDLEKLNPQRADTARVAIVFGCWGGHSSVDNPDFVWGSRGLPQTMKRLGFDYIISSVWPVSERVAHDFTEEFLAMWRSGNSVQKAYFLAYDKLLSEYELEDLALEGSSIQLFA